MTMSKHIEAEAPARLDTGSMSPAELTALRAEIIEWVGERQAGKVRRCLEQPGLCDLLDLWVGPFSRTSKAVEARGGTAVVFGYVPRPHFADRSAVHDHHESLIGQMCPAS